MTRLGSVTIQSLGEDGVVFRDDSTGQEVVLPAEFAGDAASTLQYFHDCNVGWQGTSVTESDRGGTVQQIAVVFPPLPDVWAEP